MSRMEYDDWNDIDMTMKQKYIHYMGRMASGHANIFQPTVDPSAAAKDVFDALASQVTDNHELERIDIDGLVLASHGLDPALQWKEYGLLGWEERLHDIPAHLLFEMDEQIHKSSLMTSAASRRLAEDIEDPIWEEMKMEIITDSVGSSIPPSLLTQVMECRFLPPFRPHIFSLLPVNADNMTFRLHLRADSRLQSG